MSLPKNISSQLRIHFMRPYRTVSGYVVDCPIIVRNKRVKCGRICKTRLGPMTKACADVVVGPNVLGGPQCWRSSLSLGLH